MKYFDHPNKWFMAKFDRFEPILQDSTAMKTLKECDRKYFYRIVLGFVSRFSKYQANLDFGSARHKFREVLELTGDLQQAIAAATKIKIAEPTPKFEFLTKARLMESLALDYLHWEKEKEQKVFTVLSVEQPINVQLPDGSFSAGRVDQTVEWAGQVWDRDWKTSSKDKEYFASEKDPDDQSTRYIYMLSKLHGKLIGGVIFNVLKNIKTKGPEIYTHIVSKTPKQLEIWERDQIHLNKQLKLNRDADVWPMREGQRCGFCEYAWVCRQNNEKAMMAKLEGEMVLQPWDMTKVEQGE